MNTHSASTRSRRLALGCAAALLAVLSSNSAQAFCGFYVAQADKPLYNDASKVVLAWDDGRITVTMASDYRGEAREFGLVIPVPVVVRKEDIRVVGMNLVDELDAYSQPRLTEYYDSDPCPALDDGTAVLKKEKSAPTLAYAAAAASPRPTISIEAQYQVGVYDIVILKAEQSGDLVRYLTGEGYRIPAGAEGVLGSYIAQNMHFFLAKVNLDRQAAAGEKFLRPIQVSYRSPKFMLPIRLGTVNASGPQELLVFALTRHGRVESVNYRTVQMPSHIDLPLYVHNDLASVYHAAFDRKVGQDGMTNVYTEYAWGLGTYCDPCSSPKPNSAELCALGAHWHYPRQSAGSGTAEAMPAGVNLVPESGFLTRLHVRYDRAHFPEDLAFEETRDSNQYQVIYTLHHPYTGNTACAAGRAYQRELKTRFTAEAVNLQSLTGWDADKIEGEMAQSGEIPGETPGETPELARRSLYQRFVDIFR